MNKIEVKTNSSPAAIGPYSQAIMYEDKIFVSGQLPLNPEDGNLVSDDLNEQAVRVLENLKAVLEAAGSSMEKIVKTTIFITDMGKFDVVNEIYGKYVKEPYPARSTIQVAGLPKNAQIEIEAIATR